jgi:putative membrane protein
MERKLYYGIMNPGGVLTVLFGIWLWIGYGIGDQSLWLQLKIGLVIVLVGYHVWCGRLVKRFQKEANVHSHIFYRWFNEFPVLILVGAVLLVVLKPN